MVEGSGEIAADLDMLHLIVTHRNGGRIVGEDVCCHQHWVGKQARVGRQPFGLFLLVGVTAFQQPHRSHGEQQPGQFSDLRNV